MERGGAGWGVGGGDRGDRKLRGGEVAAVVGGGKGKRGKRGKRERGQATFLLLAV